MTHFRAWQSVVEFSAVTTENEGEEGGKEGEGVFEKKTLSKI